MAWRFKNDIDRAIADLTEAIRIAPDWPDAYTYRGDIWYQKREFDRAIADYTEAIRLDPKNADVYRDRGKVWFARGEFARAIADYTEAIRLAPDNGDHPADRGFAHFCLGDFPASAADLKTALELKLGGFKKLHVALFRFIARTRAGQDATPELASYYAGFKLPDPVFELYLGRGAPEAALERPRDRCEAEFYVGQWHLIRGSRDQARTHLQLAAVDGCGFVVPHHAAAVAELKRMTP
jgi:tetratricopeptide (TPR) repeat protein